MTKVRNWALGTIAAAALLAAFPAAARDVKVGMVTTLSGPGSPLGIDVRDGFALAVKSLGGNLGGMKAEIVEADDQQKPEVAKQLADRMVEREKVDFFTGIIFSNLALAVMPGLEKNQTFFVSANAGPSQFAGANCSPFFVSASWQNDNNHEAMGQHLQSSGVKRVYLMAPNYPAGKDALAGFKRYFKGEVVGEVYTTVNQPDYAAELASLKAAAPEAVYVFYPGGMGINFVKQYAQAGLPGSVPLYGSAFTFDQDLLPAMGDAALGTKNTAHWALDLDNPANKAFVAEFEKAYNRLPSTYAAQGYDAALMIDAAIRKAGGLDDKKALQAALRSAEFPSVRGQFK
ncbi:MAG TPA: ABC transporter substrate-binding protein, partial [Alphaproteobacteria bacterium]|nr:ABC transporter substrate-binding protein [Alphaproteobacteria bacterium]